MVSVALGNQILCLIPLMLVIHCFFFVIIGANGNENLTPLKVIILDK